MSQFCFICNKLLTEDKIVVVDRGMPSLIEASVARGDEFTEYLRTQKSVTIHVDCRKSYTRKTSISAMKRQREEKQASTSKISPPRTRTRALQYDMDLECHVEAYPPPAITWLKNEVALANNQHYRISHFATADEFTDTTLRVITIEKRQYGLFTCKAQNKLGADEGTVELFESIIPVCPPACGTARYGAATVGRPSDLLAALALYVLWVRVAGGRH